MYEKDKLGYERVDSMIKMKDYLRKGYKIVSFEIEKEYGFCIATFDIESKYKPIEDIEDIHVEKIYNSEQADYYLKQEFECTVVDVGKEKKQTKNGEKDFIYVKFLVDDKFKIPKTMWMCRQR